MKVVWRKAEGGGHAVSQWTKRFGICRTEALVLILLTAFAFVINRHMEIRSLYMDDLYQWFCFNDNPFFTAVFTSGGTRFRACIIWWHGRNETFSAPMNWYVPFNIVLNSVCVQPVPHGKTVQPFCMWGDFMRGHVSDVHMSTTRSARHWA